MNLRIRFAPLVFLILAMAIPPVWAELSCQLVYSSESKVDLLKKLSTENGLRYLESPEPGYTRLKTDQGFEYFDPQGKKVTDPTVLARITALKLPGVYESVWISMDPTTHLQATGVDSKGRRQYRYHEKWDLVRDFTKFSRVPKFGSALPSLRTAVSKDLSATGLGVARRLAGVVRLLEVAVIRVGNEEYAKENGSYGLTTMQAQHVRVNGNAISFSFLGKSGKYHDFSVEDAQAAQLLRELLAVRGPNEGLFEVSSDDVNSYIKVKTQGAFTAKDFRTWIATVTAAKKLHEGATEEAAVQAAADRLRNTPEICRGSYIHPDIFKAKADGRLDQAFETIPSIGLSAEENAVLHLLGGI